MCSLRTKQNNRTTMYVFPTSSFRTCTYLYVCVYLYTKVHTCAYVFCTNTDEYILQEYIYACVCTFMCTRLIGSNRFGHWRQTWRWRSLPLHWTPTTLVCVCERECTNKCSSRTWTWWRMNACIFMCVRIPALIYVYIYCMSVYSHIWQDTCTKHPWVCSNN